MTPCLFVSDLHGSLPRYDCLFDTVLDEQPAALFLGGDILPSFLRSNSDPEEFISEYLRSKLNAFRERMGENYPRVFIILGNDDPRACEAAVIDLAHAGLWEYMHASHAEFAGHDIYGYACVPPTPFLNKDWERYDVSRYVDPGCVSPEEGFRSVAVSADVIRHTTIVEELGELAGDCPLENAIFLFHTPPYQTHLDRAALDGKMIDHVPMDVHVGSIAVRRLIEDRQPLVTLHGHIHESARLTGSWRDRIGRTEIFGAAHDGPELSLVRFDLENPSKATRELIPVPS